MARGIQNAQNVDAPTITYPDGKMRDKAGVTTGTILNENLHGDIVQFFAKLMRDSNPAVVPNGLPDNETNGYQMFMAFVNYVRNVITATESAKGTVEKATTAEAQAGTADKFIDAEKLQDVTATTTRKGIVEKSTTAEVKAGTTDKFIDADQLQNTSTDWVTPSLNTGFLQGSPNLQYRTNRGKLELRGRIINNGGNTGTIFTLPVISRPAYQTIIRIKYDDGSTLASQFFRIETNGNFSSPSGFGVNLYSVLNEIIILD